MDIETFIRLPRLWQWGGMPVERIVEGVPTTFPGEDCTTFTASWVKTTIGVDPADDLRGTYADHEGAADVVRRAGGIERLIADRIEPLGATRAYMLDDGDIGIVTAVSGIDATLKQVPALRFGPLWAVMAPRGACAKKLEWTGVAWRIG